MTLPDELREIARAGRFDWHGYDYENVVSAACEFGPEVLDEILRIVEEKGGDVSRLAWEIDDDGYTAMCLYAAKQPEIMAVFAKHGVDTTREIRCYAPYPNKDSYDRYMQKEIREALEKTARELHGDRMRPDGAARRIDHAANVSSMLLNWGIDDDSFRYFSTVSWCLGLREDIADEETLGNIDERIRTLLGCVSCRNLGGVAETAISALRLLSPASSGSADGSEHVRHVAGHAGAFELAMAIADRLCLVREWLERNETRKARAAYDEGNPLFDAGKAMQDTHFTDSDVERILAEIDAVREELEAAERTAATAPVVAAPGDAPPPCKPKITKRKENEMNTGSSKNNTDMPTVGKTDHPNTVEPAADGKRKGYTVGYQSLLNTGPINVDLHPESYPPELVEFIKSWEEKANEMFKTWHGCMWYVKFAGIQFRYKGRNYMLTPCGFGDGSNEFFEEVALNPGGMEQALADFGAEEVFYTGMLD